MFNEACVSISKELELAESIAATTDCWTSKQNYGYIGVTVHFINTDWGLTSHTLAIENVVGSHDHVTLKNKIIQVFEEWKIMENSNSYPSIMEGILSKPSESLKYFYYVTWDTQLI